MTDKRHKQLEELVAPFRVAPGTKVRLPQDFDPAFKAGISSRRTPTPCSPRPRELLSDYQARLAAQNTWGVLVVLQALDAAGKDGTVRHVMSGVDPQGVSRRQLQGPVGRGPRARLPVALRATPLPAQRRDRDLQPLALRGGLVVRVHPEILDREHLPRREAKGRVAAALSGDQRLGALPDRERLPDREGVPQPVQ